MTNKNINIATASKRIVEYLKLNNIPANQSDTKEIKRILREIREGKS